MYHREMAALSLRHRCCQFLALRRNTGAAVSSLLPIRAAKGANWAARASIGIGFRVFDT